MSRRGTGTKRSSRRDWVRPKKRRLHFMAARERAAAHVAKRPDDAKALMILAEIDARLGRKEDAVRAGEQARVFCRSRRMPWMDYASSAVLPQSMARSAKRRARSICWKKQPRNRADPITAS